MFRALALLFRGLVATPLLLAAMVIFLPIQLAYQAGLDQERMLKHGCGSPEKLGWFGKAFRFLTTLGYSKVRKGQIL